MPEPGHDGHYEEPFGQRGVLHLARPLLIFCCAFGVIGAAMMTVRSGSYYDRMVRAQGGKRIEVGSAIDRFVLTIAPARDGEEDSGGWMPASIPIGDMRDGWPGGWRKTIGIEWGYETLPAGWIGPSETYWRLRVKWRTIAIVCFIPLAAEVIRRRMQTSRHAPASKPTSSSPHEPVAPGPTV